jgi:hypothetical protein
LFFVIFGNENNTRKYYAISCRVCIIIVVVVRVTRTMAVGATTYVRSKEDSGEKYEKEKGYGYRIAKAKVGEVISRGRRGGGGDSGGDCGGGGGHLGLKREWESI